ncbi:hypothetical protein PHMEG_00040251, partial [Phytophthora megakarya]
MGITPEGGFYLDKVEALLRNVFMVKGKSQIQAMQARLVPANYVASPRPLGNRKWENEPKKKGDECFYCEGRYNRAGVTHRKADCLKMKKDRSIGLGKRVEVPPKSVGVSHVKGEKKGSKKKAKYMREEIPANVALMQPISKFEVGAVVKGTPQEPEPGYGTTLTSEQAQQDADAMMTSPPPSPTPSSSSSAMSDDENDVDECEQGYFPSQSVKLSEAS